MDEKPKSFAPKLFQPDDVGTRGLEQLMADAREELKAIVDREQSLAAHYWRLGDALELAYKELGHGQKSQFRKDLGITKPRDFRARKIRKNFGSAEDVIGLTVTEACRSDRDRHAVRMPAKSVKRQRKRANSTGNESNSLPAMFVELTNFIEGLIQQVKVAEHGQKRQLQPAFHNAMEQMSQLGRELGTEVRIDSTPSNEDPSS